MTKARMIKYCFRLVYSQLSSAVPGYHHVYRDIWKLSAGEKRVAQIEFHNQFNKFAIKLLNSEEMVSHLSYHVNC